ncbi:DUF1883 domain-containing protein [Labrenzia sp. THAF35]|uniref:DUF1883 domain-containing protein n=1 Tax=Labrenzia sp. THAF35 TaxID=2587854 RepID=UPI001AD8EB99|nr:DUF1883 domain-containing protein [Labrenzia sp. THAF35]
MLVFKGYFRARKEGYFMQFIHNDLGNRQRGEIVEISLTSGANVRLMNSSNFSNYRNGRRHQFIGGLARKSPVRLQMPSSGHWHVAIDMQGLRGSTRASVRILPGPLPEIREAPLDSLPELVRDTPPAVSESSEAYDVFISHASEDKDAIVRSLAEALQQKGLSVWYDEFALKIGDSLRRKIDAGLARSRVGLVVISPSFINKGWTNYELDGIVTRSVTGEQILLPIWHEITKQQVMDFSPSLADKVARSTAMHTVDEIADEIFDLLRS